MAYGPTSTVNRGDGLNFHEPKILTMRRSGVDLVKYVGINRRQIRVGLFAGWCRNWNMNRLLLVLLLAPFSMAAQSPLNDLDGDGCVGATDILVMLGQFGECNAPPYFSCGDSIQVDGYWHQTIQIGSQCWFAENLKTTKTNSGQDILFSDAEFWEWEGWGDINEVGFAGCVELGEEEGYMYNAWTLRLCDGICPTGWHVPTIGEWGLLTDFIGETFPIDSTGWALTSMDYGGGDIYGFNGKLVGYANSNGGHYGNGITTWWWSATLAVNLRNRAFGVNFGEPTGYGDLLYGESNPRVGNAIRCLKDPE